MLLFFQLVHNKYYFPKMEDIEVIVSGSKKLLSLNPRKVSSPDQMPTKIERYHADILYLYNCEHA